MDDKRTSAAWIGAALLLVAPVAYLGSYWALVRPFAVLIPVPGESGSYDVRHYRWGGDVSETIYWPVEQLDRPDAWGEPLFH